MSIATLVSLALAGTFVMGMFTGALMMRLQEYIYLD